MGQGKDSFLRPWTDDSRTLTDEASSILVVKQVFKLYKFCRIWGFHSGGFEEYILLGYDAV
jgi:hypothetical protein